MNPRTRRASQPVSDIKQRHTRQSMPTTTLSLRPSAHLTTAALALVQSRSGTTSITKTGFAPTATTVEVVGPTRESVETARALLSLLSETPSAQDHRKVVRIDARNLDLDLKRFVETTLASMPGVTSVVMLTPDDETAERGEMLLAITAADETSLAEAETRLALRSLDVETPHREITATELARVAFDTRCIVAAAAGGARVVKLCGSPLAVAKARAMVCGLDGAQSSVPVGVVAAVGSSGSSSSSAAPLPANSRRPW